MAGELHVDFEVGGAGGQVGGMIEQDGVIAGGLGGQFFEPRQVFVGEVGAGQADQIELIAADIHGDTLVFQPGQGEALQQVRHDLGEVDGGAAGDEVDA